MKVFVSTVKIGVQFANGNAPGDTSCLVFTFQSFESVDTDPKFAFK